MEKSRTKITILIMLGLYILLSLIYFIIYGKEGILMAALYSITFNFLFLATGILLAIINKSRDVGIGLILGSLLIIVIGFSVCTITSIN